MLNRAAQEFLSNYIDSAEQIDVVMLMFRDPQAVWTADALSAAVFSVPQSIQRRLDELKQRGLVVERADQPDAYALRIDDAEQRAGLESLYAEYQRSRADVINAVFEMKRDPLKSFSNAFKFRS